MRAGYDPAMKKPEATVVARLLVGLSLLFVAMSSGCGADRQRCDLANRSSCGTTSYCVADSDGVGYCEPLKSCNPGDPLSCLGGFLCRPSAAGGSVCELETTARRISACLDSAGIDVFAVEANGALSVTWNVNGAIDSAGGFEVTYGTAMDMLTVPTRVNANTREAVLGPLNNGTAYYVVVRALGARWRCVVHVLLGLRDAARAQVPARSSRQHDYRGGAAEP